MRYLADTTKTEKMIFLSLGVGSHIPRKAKATFGKSLVCVCRKKLLNIISLTLSAVSIPKFSYMFVALCQLTFTNIASASLSPKIFDKTGSWLPGVWISLRCTNELLNRASMASANFAGCKSVIAHSALCV